MLKVLRFLGIAGEKGTLLEGASFIAVSFVANLVEPEEETRKMDLGFDVFGMVFGGGMAS